MINSAEIDAKAREFEINTSNVQRDYVFGWILHGLFRDSRLRDRLFLKGGNALRKGYFADTRFSRDLDLGIPDDISDEALREEINRVCNTVRERAGIPFVIEDTKVEEKFAATDAPLPGLRVWEVRVYFEDFYGKKSSMVLKVSMDLTRFDRVMLPLQDVALIHPYSDAAAATCQIRCMKLEEIIATKLKCLMQRQHAPDLFDYAYSIRLLGGSLDRGEVVQVLLRKTIFSRNPWVLKEILSTVSLDFVREQWTKSVIVARQARLDVEDAIRAFADDLGALFQGYQGRGYGDLVFFPAAQRNTIMEAGRRQRVLRILYRGEERLVEPYSLKYQQRRDGAELEYFFAHKLSGGSSGPGIKRFLASEMHSVEITEVPFEPRHPIELSKAGEYPEDRYLFDSNKPERAPRRTGIRRPRRAVSRIKYVYKCAVCGKQFTKVRNSGSLGPHKNRHGSPCGGRYGIYVTTRYS